MTTTKRSPIPAEFAETNVGGATPAQQNYAKDLLAKLADRDLADRALARYNALVEAHGLTKAKASEIITWAQGQPKGRVQPVQVQTQAPIARGQVGPRVAYREVQTDKGDSRQVGYLEFVDGTTVLAGSYGVDTSGDDRFTNDTSFFRVWIQKQGQDYGKGWNVQLYTSDDTTRVKLAVPTQLDMLRAIAKDPVAAASLYGHEFKRCGVCGRGLTNDASRERGIGPVCAGNLGLYDRPLH
jgi:Family of unknown function (DUF6011)